MAGSGGARPNSGRPKGKTGIQANEFIAALEKRLGIPVQEAAAEIAVILFNDFKNGENQKLAVSFWVDIIRRTVQALPQQVEITDVDKLSEQEIEERIKEKFTKRKGLIPPLESSSDDQDKN